jgi:hypothetical protein
MPRLNTSEIHSEIQLIKKDVEFLRESQIKVQSDIAEIKKTLLDPDDGAIARVNKNTEFRKVASAALWSIWLTMLGVLAKLIFWE